MKTRIYKLAAILPFTLLVTTVTCNPTGPININLGGLGSSLFNGEHHHHRR